MTDSWPFQHDDAPQNKNYYLKHVAIMQYGQIGLANWFAELV